MSIVRLLTIFDALTVLRDDYDTSTVTGIEVCNALVLTAEQRATLKRLRARIRKRLNRAGKREILLPLPVGTACALDRIMAAAGFDDPRDFIAYQIHRLDGLLTGGDVEAFRAQAVRTVTVGDLSHYHHRIGSPVPAEDDDHDSDDDSALRQAESVQD